MEWTYITTAISLGVIALCVAILTFFCYHRRSNQQEYTFQFIPTYIYGIVERAISWIILLGVTIAVIVLYNRTNISTNDNFAGVLVTVLSILVTALIGWQILKSVQIEKHVRQSELAIERLKGSLRKRFRAYTWFQYHSKMISEKDWDGALISSVTILSDIDLLEDEWLIAEMMDSLDIIFKAKKASDFKSQDIERLKTLLKKVKDKRAISIILQLNKD